MYKNYLPLKSSPTHGKFFPGEHSYFEILSPENSPNPFLKILRSENTPHGKFPPENLEKNNIKKVYRETLTWEVRLELDVEPAQT